MLRRPRKSADICFVYAEGKRRSGSTIMRGHQLAALAQRALPDRTIRVAPYDFTFRNTTLFLTKGALKCSDPTRLAELRKRGNRLIFDPVDGPPPAALVDFADVIVAASFTALDDFAEEFERTATALLNHHVDPRIERFDIACQPDRFRAVYFGLPRNTLVTPAIAERVEFIRARKPEDGWFRYVSDFTFHYAIRQVREFTRYKPFLKGFTAAACNANMLIQRTEVEAVRWLGDDYPYLLRSAVDEATIVAALEAARQDYGSRDWLRGLAVMQRIKDQTADAHIARQLCDVIALAES